MKYEKLVRDNIPDIIKKQGKTPIIKVLSEDEYRAALNKKLLEEVNEYLENSCVEEFCDILEILDAIKKSMNFSDTNIDTFKSAKAMQNGKFDKQLFLEEVVE
ncbi:MAG: nucleoside triphosphate pyrophosphohydrolase [Oscillospiraceae bacterium]|nr:nucleoside triphosphate pyrophosphohydrolase [Oscillospiraceae bacterium]